MPQAGVFNFGGGVGVWMIDMLFDGDRCHSAIGNTGFDSLINIVKGVERVAVFCYKGCMSIGPLTDKVLHL